MVQSYRDLIVYQKAFRLSLDIYKATMDFPREEIYGLVSQMRRSAVSITCNIAEGYRRGHCKEYIQFLYMAHGSCAELETLLSLCFDLSLLNKDIFEKIYSMQEEVSRFLYRLISSLVKTRKQ